MNRALARATLLCLCCGACSRLQSVEPAAADQAQWIAGLWHLLLWVCGSVYLLVLGGLAYALASRRGAGRDRIVGQGLVLWVGVIALVLSGLTIASYVVDRKLVMKEVAKAADVRITGKQWWWQLEVSDPDPSQSFTGANELHLEVGKKVTVDVGSADVIHSLWIPRLNGKQDLIPGRVNRIEFTPREVGWFRGQCAEFCGLQHARMALDVRVDTPTDYQRWRLRQLLPAIPPATPTQRLGQAVFLRSACAMCHAIRGTEANGRSGPDLTHVASRRRLAAGTLAMNRGNLAGWIADPQHPKPGNHMPAVELEPLELEALVDYLASLR
jgi:cytochrome c oxidase subunit II